MVLIHNLVPFLVVSLIIAVVILVFQLIVGKDKKPKVIKVEYSLPEGMTPAIAGTLIDESADVVDVIATVFDLEARGYVKLVPMKRSKYFAGDNKETDILIKVSNKDLKGLSEYEAQIMNFILEQYSLKEQVFFKDFGEKFASEINDLRRKIEDVATKEGYFEAPPYSVRIFFTTFYIMLLIVGDIIVYKFGGISIPFNPYNPLSHMLNMSIVVLFAFVPLVLTYPLYSKLKKSVALRTQKGVEAFGRILGLREFIKRVEKERIKRMAEKDPNIFKKVLPYAIILGLTKEWAEKMEKEYVEFPDWFGVLNEAEREIIIDILNTLAGRRRIAFMTPNMISPVSGIWDTLDKRR